MKTSTLPRFRALLLGCLLFAGACSGSPSTTTTTQPGGGTGAGTAEPDPTDVPGDDPGPAVSAPGRGETCGADDVCSEGLECVSYYGIAGASGPEFKSCETRCAGKGSACPEGTTCTTIADGPGAVCR